MDYFFGISGETIVILFGIGIIVYNQNQMTKGLDRIYKAITHKEE